MCKLKYKWKRHFFITVSVRKNVCGMSEILYFFVAGPSPSGTRVGIIASAGFAKRAGGKMPAVWGSMKTTAVPSPPIAFVAFFLFFLAGRADLAYCSREPSQRRSIMS